jgi:hypothetical protein
VERSRETWTNYRLTIGSMKNILRVIDDWYSPDPGINVKVIGHEPRQGVQTPRLTDSTRSAADPRDFDASSGYKIIDHRLVQPGLRHRPDTP